jgi:HEAT repeat protein
MAAKRAFRAIGAAAVPDLLAALESPDSRTRFYAARALGHLGKHGAAAVSALTEALRTDRDYGVRASAATALGAIGPPARAALPALRKAVGNTNTAFSGQPDRDALRAAAQVAIRNILHPPRARSDDDLGGHL